MTHARKIDYDQIDQQLRKDPNLGPRDRNRRIQQNAAARKRAERHAHSETAQGSELGGPAQTLSEAEAALKAQNEAAAPAADLTGEGHNPDAVNKKIDKIWEDL